MAALGGAARVEMRVSPAGMPRAEEGPWFPSSHRHAFFSAWELVLIVHGVFLLLVIPGVTGIAQRNEMHRVYTKAEGNGVHGSLFRAGRSDSGFFPSFSLLR